MLKPVSYLQHAHSSDGPLDDDRRLVKVGCDAVHDDPGVDVPKVEIHGGQADLVDVLQSAHNHFVPDVVFQDNVGRIQRVVGPAKGTIIITVVMTMKELMFSLFGQKLCRFFD